MPQIQYISAGEAAKKWGISHRRVITLCKQNRIPNVAMLGHMWIIPIEAEKPADIAFRPERGSVDPNLISLTLQVPDQFGSAEPEPFTEEIP